jgi:phage N-6-adenine-methyltransferase
MSSTLIILIVAALAFVAIVGVGFTFTSGKDDYGTPPDFWQRLDDEFHFQLDAAAWDWNAKAPAWLTVFEDSLTLDWRWVCEEVLGVPLVVWLNPPYGSQLKVWLKRLAEHGNGIALVPARTEVESWFWPYVWEAADTVLFLRGRLYFLTPEGEERGNAGHGSVLVAYGYQASERLRLSRIEGRAFSLKEGAL